MTAKPGRRAIPADAFDHGDVRRYRRGCTCTPCVNAATRDGRIGKYLRATGRGRITTTDRAATHIRRLRAAPMTDAAIQEAARLSPEIFYRILRGGGRLNRATEARILAVQPTPTGARNGGHINGLGTRRRLQTLTANGWPAAQLGARLGKTKQNVLQLLQPSATGLVRQWVADQVRDLYDQLAAIRPEDAGVLPRYAARSRKLAADRGWADSNWWDPDDFDNPDFEPATAEQQAKRIEVIAEDAEWLQAAGYDTEHIAERLGVSRAYVHKALRHYSTAA